MQRDESAVDHGEFDDFMRASRAGSCDFDADLVSQISKTWPIRSSSPYLRWIRCGSRTECWQNKTKENKKMRVAFFHHFLIYLGK